MSYGAARDFDFYFASFERSRLRWSSPGFGFEVLDVVPAYYVS